MKKQSGITLISLVVTIIVLIILAGISINLILGQDGIINRAKEAKQNMEYAQIEEQEQLNELYDQMIGQGSGALSYDAIAKLVEFKKEIANAITEMGVETSEDASADTMANNIKNISSNSNNNLPYINKFTQNIYTHQSWTGNYRPTYDLTIVPNGANTITLGIDQSASGDYSSYGTPSISNITNGTYSGLVITPTNKDSEITVTISFSAEDLVTYSGATFVKSIYIKSFS